MQIPSLPFLPSANILEILWVAAGCVATLLAWRSWHTASSHRIKLKNIVRCMASAVFTFNGILAMFTQPPASISWLSVLTPLAIVFGVTSMALLSVIDEQDIQTNQQPWPPDSISSSC